MRLLLRSSRTNARSASRHHPRYTDVFRHRLITRSRRRSAWRASNGAHHVACLPYCCAAAAGVRARLLHGCAGDRLAHRRPGLQRGPGRVLSDRLRGDGSGVHHQDPDEWLGHLRAGLEAAHAPGLGGRLDRHVVRRRHEADGRRAVEQDQPDAQIDVRPAQIS